MPNIKCPVTIDCPGFDDPIMNYSSEAPDIPDFFTIGFPPFNPDDPLTPVFTSAGCDRVCTSSVSQDAADACANIDAWLCLYGPGGPGGNPLTPVFYNDAQTCGFPCPDGSTFFWTVLAGFVVTGNQDLSNRIAAEIACERAAQRHLCLPSLNEACLNDEFSQTITITSGVPPLVYTITAGSLPPGITMTQTDSRTVVFAGTPTNAGSFPFTLTVQDPDGNYMSKHYVFQVLGITPTTLPDGNKGSAYNHALSGIGGQGPYTFELELGDLPDGLTLADDGTISGTPTVNGTFDFTVSISDSIDGFCTQDFTILINSGCFDWTTLPWDTANTGGAGAFAASFAPSNASQDNFTASVFAATSSDFAFANNQAGFTYHGPACNCKLHFDGVLIGHTENMATSATCVASITGVLFAFNFNTSASMDVLFSLPDCTITPQSITITISLAINGILSGPTTYNASGKFSNP